MVHRAAATGANQRSHSVRRRRARSGPMPVTRTSLPAAALVAVANRCSASRLCSAKRSSTCRSTAGRQAELITVGIAKTTSRISAGLDGGQQRHGQHDPDDPADGAEQRHVHVVQHEHLVAQHGETVEVVASLLQLEPGDRGLQGGDVRLQGDGHPVAEAPGQSVVDHPEQPAERRRRGHRPEHGEDHRPVAVGEPVGQQREPEREQRIRHRRKQGDGDHHDDQSRLVGVADLAQPPHGREGGRQVVGGLRRGSPGNQRTSNTAPSSSMVASNRRACSSNMV